jgi:hypothetical protein
MRLRWGSGGGARGRPSCSFIAVQEYYPLPQPDWIDVGHLFFDEK